MPMKILATKQKMGFPCGLAGKEPACNAGELDSISGLGRYPGEGKGYPLQYSGLENSTDCIAHEVAKNWILLSDFHFHKQKIPLNVWFLFHHNGDSVVVCKNLTLIPRPEVSPR